MFFPNVDKAIAKEASLQEARQNSPPPVLRRAQIGVDPDITKDEASSIVGSVSDKDRKNFSRNTSFSNFMKLHEAQLSSMGLPECLYQSVYDKLYRSEDDSVAHASAFQIQRTAQGEACVLALRNIDPNQDVFIVNHAFHASNLQQAIDKLKDDDALLNRLWTLMDLDVHLSQHDIHHSPDLSVEELRTWKATQAWDAMFRYNYVGQYFVKVASAPQSTVSSIASMLHLKSSPPDNHVEPVYFIHEALGTSLSTSCYPNAKLHPLTVLDESPYACSILWAIKPIAAGEKVQIAHDNRVVKPQENAPSA